MDMRKGKVKFKLDLLPDKNKRNKCKYEGRGILLTAHDIRERSSDIDQRNWEADTVLSTHGEDKSYLATFLERKSRLLWTIKIPDRISESMELALDQFFNCFGSSIESITTNHGKEFAHNIYFEHKYKTTFYSCHPCSPWEKGTNKRLNKSLRYFFPKRTNFSLVTHDQVIESLELINNKPLKVLNNYTAIEKFHDNLLKCLN